MVIGLFRLCGHLQTSNLMTDNRITLPTVQPSTKYNRLVVIRQYFPFDVFRHGAAQNDFL